MSLNMGLGPPVCTKCQVIMRLDEQRTGRAWYCPYCDQDSGGDFVKNLWLFPKSVQELIEKKTNRLENGEEMSAIGYVPITSFYIDDGELNDLPREKCFVLGVEWASFRHMLLNVEGEFTYEIHEENRDRIICLLDEHNREYEVELKEVDETWLSITVTGNPRLRLV